MALEFLMLSVTLSCASWSLDAWANGAQITSTEATPTVTRVHDTQVDNFDGQWT